MGEKAEKAATSWSETMEDIEMLQKKAKKLQKDVHEAMKELEAIERKIRALSMEGKR